MSKEGTERREGKREKRKRSRREQRLRKRLKRSIKKKYETVRLTIFLQFSVNCIEVSRHRFKTTRWPQKCRKLQIHSMAIIRMIWCHFNSGHSFYRQFVLSTANHCKSIIVSQPQATYTLTAHSQFWLWLILIGALLIKLIYLPSTDI